LKGGSFHNTENNIYTNKMAQLTKRMIKFRPKSFMGLDPGVDFIKKIWCEFTYSILKARSFNDREKQCFSHQNGLAYIKV
jgi:hypothetical protein